jgi:uncharacterized protein YkwD
MLRRSIALLTALTCLPLALAAEESPERAAEHKLVELVNADRQKLGLRPLREKAQLRDVAYQHSEEMTRLNYFSHSSPTSALESLQKRLRAGRCGELVSGENLYAGECTLEELPQVTLQAWLASPAHRNNLLSPNFNAVGIGIARNGNRYRITQVFTKETTDIVRCEATRQGEVVSVTLEGRVIEGPREGVILFNRKRVANWSAASDGTFQCSFQITGGGKLEIGQVVAPRQWSIETELPLPELDQANSGGVDAPLNP